MDALMTIGDFSRAVRLSAKALRFYHHSGVLTPAVIDDQSGYRLYAPEQISDAQIVRTLRGLDLPVDSIRHILSTSDVEARTALIADHLTRMKKKLDETRAAVQGLRSMLDAPRQTIEIGHRSIAAMPVVAVRAALPLRELGGWFRRSIATLQRIAERSDPASLGSFGGVWSGELFEEEYGTAVVFFGVTPGFDPQAMDGDAIRLELPSVELAVATHDGPDDTLPLVYAALGEHVARHELSIDGPVRETYLSGFPSIDDSSVTEIGWPIFRVSR